MCIWTHKTRCYVTALGCMQCDWERKCVSAYGLVWTANTAPEYSFTVLFRVFLLLYFLPTLYFIPSISLLCFIVLLLVSVAYNYTVVGRD